MDHKICRICCENSGNSNIFHTNCNGILISSKIMFCCTKIQVSENDGLPSHICSPCEEDLAIAYRFVTKCITTDRILRTQDSEMNSNENKLYPPKLEVKTEETDYDLNIDSEPVDYNSQDELELPLKAVSPKFQQESGDLFHNAVTKITKKTNKHTRKRIRNRGPIDCLVCGREFANLSTLTIHMRSHSNEKPYQCDICDNKYKDPNTLKRHSERNHLKVRERRFICENCGKGFFTTTEIITHMRTHTKETPYSCSECPASYTQLSSLIRHRKKHRGDKSEKCDVCPKRFCTKDQLKRHLLVHTNTKSYTCNICNSVFKYKHNLTKHQKLHSEPDSFVCNYCGHTFNTKGNLKLHIKRLHSEKSGYCKTCSKIVSNIEVHMWKHTGERPLKCELCTKSFYESRALSHHMNFRHKHVGKYKCTVENCHQNFPSKSMLDFHIAKQHESRFVFPCDKCPRGFYRKNDLARHMIGTHKVKLL